MGQGTAEQLEKRPSKARVSVPVTDELLREIDSRARRLSVSRSTLLARLLQYGLEAEQLKRDQRLLRFQTLLAQWHLERGPTSSIEEMCTRPAYLSIIAMGPEALPLIIGQLRSEGNNPDHWFVALHYIAKGTDPVPDEDKGDMVKMSKAWLDWAEREMDVG
jgi:hypothetical protein